MMIFDEECWCGVCIVGDCIGEVVFDMFDYCGVVEICDELFDVEFKFGGVVD